MIDLQQALKLYRRQGVVAVQNKHLQRTVASARYPESVQDTVKVTSEELTGAIKRPPKVAGSAVGFGGVNFAILLRETTVYRDVISPASDAVGLGGLSFQISLKTTTVYTEAPVQAGSAVGMQGMQFAMTLTPLPVEAVASTTVQVHLEWV